MCRQAGTPADRSAGKLDGRPVGARAGLQASVRMPICFYCRRHSFATRCIEAGCDYKTVSVLLGHSNISTTLNLYVHPNMEQKRRCISKMFKSLGSRKETAGTEGILDV